MEDAVKYFRQLLKEIAILDPLHAKTLKESMPKGKDTLGLMNLIYSYFRSKNVPAKTLAHDYLHMINDMRREAVYFDINGTYSCKNQAEAYEKVYSDPVVMVYYMNALLVSQVLWSHHFDMLQFFKKQAEMFRDIWGCRILDIGSGHGIFAWTIKDITPQYDRIDILDISEVSLGMVEDIIGESDDIHYLLLDLNGLNPHARYEFIIMGEILEHLDNPLDILKKAVSHLTTNGMMWITIPTNAPAIDHVYLFKDKSEVFKLIDDAGLTVLNHLECKVDYLTSLIGVFCVKK